MKEAYFTDSNFIAQSMRLLDTVIEFRQKHKWNFNKRNIALLILDIQKYFFDPESHAYIPSSPPIANNIKKLKDLAFSNNIPIILTKHTASSTGKDMMKKWWHDSITERDSMSHFAEFIDVNKSDFVLTKNQYDAFYKTALDDILTSKNISQLIICGVMTHLCCETTARAGFTRGYEVFFTIDATATYNKDFHQSTLLNLSHGFAIPMLTSEIFEELQK